MKREDAQRFIDHLIRLKDRDRGALAALRHSLAFAPGDDPKAFPFVEGLVGRLVGRDCHPADPRRLALYAVAGLFAAHPVLHAQPLAAALGRLLREKERPSLELRFRALLEADADSAMPHLRQAVSLLSADGLGYDHAGLLCDLTVWLNERADPAWRDDIKRRWARGFYGALQADDAADATPTTTP
jgi:CRISPR system Cascade subunit CasB